MSTITGVSVPVVAREWIANEGNRAAITKAVAERASTSKRKRWANLARAMAANDLARITAYAADTAEGRKTAWAAVRAAATPAPKAPKPRAKAAKKPNTDAMAALMAALAKATPAQVQLAAALLGLPTR